MNIKKMLPIVLIFVVFTAVLFYSLSMLSLVFFPKQYFCATGNPNFDDKFYGRQLMLPEIKINSKKCELIDKLSWLSIPLLSTLFTAGFVYLDSPSKNKKSPPPKK